MSIENQYIQDLQKYQNNLNKVLIEGFKGKQVSKKDFTAAVVGSIVLPISSLYLGSERNTVDAQEAEVTALATIEFETYELVPQFETDMATVYLDSRYSEVGERSYYLHNEIPTIE